MPSSGSGSAKNSGLAFEWAVATAFFSILQEDYPAIKTEVQGDQFSAKASSALASYGVDAQVSRQKAARLGALHIVERETALIQASRNARIQIMSDVAGRSGDVRDVVIHLDGDKSIGISCKNNHHDFKHPRLGPRIDFVSKWRLGDACTDDYWAKTMPVFDYLKNLRATRPGVEFRSLPNVPETILWPVLEGFHLEVIRQIALSSDGGHSFCQSLVQYIIGTKDFYKLINDTSTKSVLVEEFNFNGTLHGKRSAFPTSLIDVENLEPDNDLVERRDPTKVFTFDRGYSFSFRLHTADSLVKPSLKFGIGAVGLPHREIYTHHIANR